MRTDHIENQDDGPLIGDKGSRQKPLVSIMDIGANPQPRNMLREKIVVDRQNQTCTLFFSARYEIDLDNIRSEGHLLAWVLHLAGKGWMDRDKLRLFIEVVAKEKNFTLLLR